MNNDPNPSVDPNQAPLPTPEYTSPYGAPSPAPAPVPTPFVEPAPMFAAEPELPPEPPKKKSRKGLKAVLVILLALLAVAGIGYSVFAFRQNESQSTALSAKDTQISTLNAQITTLKAAAAKTAKANTTAPVVSGLVEIEELGVSITVPDSIKDLVYSYEGNNKVAFSTKTLKDKASATAECTTGGVFSSLGTISKVSGQFKAVETGPQLIKQFASYYVIYEKPESSCPNVTPAEPTEAKTLVSALATVKEL